MQSKIIKRLKLSTAILKRHGVLLAYVYGSVLGRYFNKESDIDIAVLLPESYNPRKRFRTMLRLMHDLSVLLGHETEVVVLNDLTALHFKYTVISEGKIFFSTRERAEFEFESRLMSEYFDFMPFLDRFNKAYLDRHG